MKTKSNYDVIIIGAGIGGLTAGNILVKNGKKVLILEKNQVPGGAVTTFYKNSYPLDISHSLGAMKEGSFIRKTFDYLNIFKNIEFQELNKLFICIKENNVPIFCYANIERYKDELKNNFPTENNNIDRLFKIMEGIWSKEILKSYYDPSMLRFLSYPFLFPNLTKYRNYTFEQFLSTFTNNTALKETVSGIWPYLGVNRFAVSAIYMICAIMSYHREGSFFVKGGFGKISQSLALNFIRLGGEILYNVKVNRVLLNTRKSAYGVSDTNNNVYKASKITSNVDTKKTFLELVGKDLLPRKLLKKVNMLKMSCSALQMHIIAEAQINKEFLSVGTITLSCYLDLEKKLRAITNIRTKSLSKSVLMLSIHPLNQFTAINGKNTYVFNVGWLPACYKLWESFFVLCGREVYENMKKEIIGEVIKELKKTWNITEIRFTNMLTPLSFGCWLNSTNGAIYDSASIPSQMLFNRFKNRTAIENLYFVGAKTFPGHSIAGALLSSLFLCDIMLAGKITNRRFTPIMS